MEYIYFITEDIYRHLKCKKRNGFVTGGSFMPCGVSEGRLCDPYTAARRSRMCVFFDNPKWTEVSNML